VAAVMADRRAPLPDAFRLLPVVPSLALARETVELRRQVRPGSIEAAALRRAQGGAAEAVGASTLRLLE
jgi:hypothetical protein